MMIIIVMQVIMIVILIVYTPWPARFSSALKSIDLGIAGRVLSTSPTARTGRNRESCCTLGSAAKGRGLRESPEGPRKEDLRGEIGRTVGYRTFNPQEFNSQVRVSDPGTIHCCC